MARVAFVLDEMFEDSEFRVPYDRLKEAGHEVVVIGRDARKFHGKRGRETVTADLSIRDAVVDDYEALVIPGGYAPDRLRMIPPVVAFVREFFNSGRPTAAVCHAGSLLVEAGVVEGRTMTSWPSIRTDLKNAGALWVDHEVVEDGHLITSRKPDDLPAFTDAILRQLEGEIPDPISFGSQRSEPPSSGLQL